MVDASERELVARCLRGDVSGFEPIVERYNRLLFGVAFRLLGNYQDACDATQDAFIKAFEHLDSYDPDRKLFSWLYRILVNECLNVRRARRASEPLDERLADPVSPLEAVVEGERRRRIQAALDELPFDSRQVVVLRHFAELSYGEIAETLGIAEKTVKSRLFTARQRLAELLAARGERR
jgi:RNA polymerase sigma-70 factor (ECF subfamily)